MQKSIEWKIKMPQISIIVPVYETEKYLDRCLHSILNGDFNDIEVLLINDGSPNGAACNKYANEDNRVRVVHRKHEGVSASRNIGIHLASAPCIGFVDSDDLIHPKMYSDLHELMQTHKADIVSCGMTEFTESESVSFQSYSLDKKYPLDIIKMDRADALKRFLRSDPITSSVVWGKLYDKRLFDDVTFPIRKVSGDAIVAYKLYHKATHIVHTHSRYYYYAIRRNSITNSGFSLSSMEKLVTSDEIINFIRADYPDLMDHARCFQTVTALRLAAYFDKDTITLHPQEYSEVKEILACPENRGNALLSPRHRSLLFLYNYCKPAFMMAWNHRLKSG